MKIPGKTDMGDIMASVSTDDGNTWGDPVFIFNHLERQGTLQFAYANAILFKVPEQDVMWAFAMRCPMNYRHSEDSQLVGAYSADGGRSWVPVEMSMAYTGPLICVAGPHRVVENGVPRFTGTFNEYRLYHPLEGLRYLLGQQFAFVKAIGQRQRQVWPRQEPGEIDDFQTFEFHVTCPDTSCCRRRAASRLAG